MQGYLIAPSYVVKNRNSQLSAAFVQKHLKGTELLQVANELEMHQYAYFDYRFVVDTESSCLFLR